MALDRPDKREVDQFDNDHAIYLLALEGDEVVGGTRFVPTIYPHLMSEVFPELASVRGLQRGYDVVEWTRIFVIPSKRGDGTGHTLADEVLAGMLEFCLEEGFSKIAVVCETFWLPRWLEIGWKAKPLGPITQIEDMECLGVVIDVDIETLEQTREVRNVPANVLVRRSCKPGIVSQIIEEHQRIQASRSTRYVG